MDFVKRGGLVALSYLALSLFVCGLCGVGYQRCGSGGCVEPVAGLQVVEALAVVVFSIPDRDALWSVHRQVVSVDCDGGALVEA